MKRLYYEIANTINGTYLSPYMDIYACKPNDHNHLKKMLQVVIWTSSSKSPLKKMFYIYLVYFQLKMEN